MRRALQIFTALAPSPAFAYGLPNFDDGEALIILIVVFGFFCLVGLVPAAILFAFFRKKAIFLLSPIFGCVFYFVIFVL